MCLHNTVPPPCQLWIKHLNFVLTLKAMRRNQNSFTILCSPPCLKVSPKQRLQLLLQRVKWNTTGNLVLTPFITQNKVIFPYNFQKIWSLKEHHTKHKSWYSTKDGHYNSAWSECLTTHSIQIL